MLRPKRTSVAAWVAVVAVIAGLSYVLTGAAVPPASAQPQAPAAPVSKSHPRGGHLYMQTNEIRNAIIHYRWTAHGKLIEVKRVATGGAGSGTFKPISGQESAPNAFEGAGSVILTADRRFLFATNGGDNSVSSFGLDKDGRLKLLDVKPTGNAVDGKSGTAKSLAYSPSKGILYVLHSFGPDHLRLMSVDDQGKIKARPERHTVNTKDKTDRVPTMAVLSSPATGATSASATSTRSSRRSPRTLSPRATSAIRTMPRPTGSSASITPSCARRPRSRSDADRGAPQAGAPRLRHHPSYPGGAPHEHQCLPPADPRWLGRSGAPRRDDRRRLFSLITRG
jgi:hypothetical protein